MSEPYPDTVSPAPEGRACAFVPQPRRVTAADAPAWRPGASTRVLVQERHHDRLAPTARVLAEDLARQGYTPGLPEVAPYAGESEAGPEDLVLRLDTVSGAPGGEQEAYHLTLAAPAVLTAHTERGVHQAGRTLLQSLRPAQPRVAWEVTDWPAYPVRGLTVDAGRRAFSVRWLEGLIRELSALKLNELHLHLSDSLAFRVESGTHPEIVSPQALTKAELRGLAGLAARHHIALVPEFDTPGHLRSVLEAHPELRLRLADGTVRGENLDYSLPEARALVRDLLHEYAELMPGDLFHLGGDAYFGNFWEPEHRITPELAPQLARYAREHAGTEEATLHDGYAAYLNELAGVLRAHGKRARVWNDEIVPSGAVRLHQDVQVDTWIRWSHAQPSAADYLRAGYDVVNGHGDHLYYVHAGEAPHMAGPGSRGKKSAPGIYEDWTPRTVMDAPGEDAELLADEPGVQGGGTLLGAHMSVWCDAPGPATEDEIAQDTAPWKRAFAERMWCPSDSARDHEAFERRYAVLDAAR
ncbi:family 20 glycosylhydrolase [Streptomyces iconiensis]|uniref:Family 20 glycosylhydrolase n=1 Tax=Streptomyces iconiensis TaxID=1384038 RepID=A0ABT7A6Q7_9ACTN|nr:family 20 glycosylhydrolase [Streptomyces iconiensis]MDJ1136986.1 family 20 glycosylhydrolase [Streptomyces iconiensis]